MIKLDDDVIVDKNLIESKSDLGNSDDDISSDLKNVNKNKVSKVQT